MLTPFADSKTGRGKQQQQQQHQQRPQPRQLSVAKYGSLLISAYCVICGGVFLGMAGEGDRKCRELMGDILWEGATPKIVVIDSDGLLRGGCNFAAIKTIQSDLVRGPTIDRLPTSLSRLERLESLVLSGHKIASDGVPARILDGGFLPLLTRLDLGKKSPATRYLDLTKSGAYLDAFPSHLLEFMTELETLDLGGTNVSCFPSRVKFSRLSKLRDLNLSGTSISYLPPSALFGSLPRLQVLDLSDTPVSISLNWSEHGLGSAVYDPPAEGYDDPPVEVFDWHRLATTLPLLESLDLSSNGFADADTLGLNLTDLQRLRHIDVSHNPKLTPPIESNFSWWNVLSEHPVLGAAAPSMLAWSCMFATLDRFWSKSRSISSSESFRLASCVATPFFIVCNPTWSCVRRALSFVM